jgi:hypothetical protein
MGIKKPEIHRVTFVSRLIKFLSTTNIGSIFEMCKKKVELFINIILEFA